MVYRTRMSDATLVRAGVYGRQSKDKTKSIDEQTAECEADIAGLAGWVVAERYADGVSASRFARQARKDWPRLLGDIDAGRLDALVLWESSRGDRDPESWLALLSKCRERGVRIRVTSHATTYDVRSARSWKSLAEDGIDSAFESEKISLRLRRAAAAQAAAGRPHGRIIYGYSREYHPTTRQLVAQRPDPLTAPVVVEIVTRLSRGEAVGGIVRDLNARGIPSPRGGRWERNTLRGIGLNPAYAGVRVLRGQQYAAIWPALVAESVHLAAKRVLVDPARKKSRPGRQRWLLSYLARCCCGEFMRGMPWRESKPLADRYVCRRYTKGCVSVVAGSLDGDVSDGLDPFVMGLVAARLADSDMPLERSDDAAVLAARAEVEQLTARLDQWRDSAVLGETSPASLARIEAQLLEQIAAANRRAEVASRPVVLGEALDLAARTDPGMRRQVLAAHLGALPVEVKREIISALMTITVNRATTWGRHQFDPERVGVVWKA